MAHHGHQYGYGPYPNYPNGQPYRAPPHEVMHKFGNRNNADPEPPPSPEPPREAWGRRHDLSDGTSETHITGMLPSQLLSSTADVNGQTWYQQSNQLSSNNLSPETHSRAYSNSRHRGRTSLGRICTRYPSSYFTPGRIFIVRWPENAGQRDASRSGNSEIFYDSQGNRFFSTWRRMIVVSTYPGSNSSTCVGIYTYGGRGLSKHGIHVESHAVLYDEREGRPTMSSGEPEVRREALAVNLHSRSEKLDPMSRANFGNLHTVQHNIEICNIGQISTRSMATFNAYVNERFDAIRRF